jgi:homoserine O-acetyltransferase
MTKKFNYSTPFRLESGRELPGFHLAYTTQGQLNERGDNAVWIFHALTANSSPAEWWEGLVGPGRVFDPSRDFIVCVNIPGSCYGSISPLDIDPDTGTPYYHRFPLFTTRDVIRTYQQLRQHLGIRRIKVGAGGSLGGQQLLEWAIEEPALFERIIPIATNARHSAWGIAFNASQRLCIESDPTWKQASPKAGLQGMAIARGLALLSYRSYATYATSQEGVLRHEPQDTSSPWYFRAESYQRYQGEKLAKRFTAWSYYFLSKTMDAHDVGRGRGGLEAALAKISARTLVIGISSDGLFPPSEQELLARFIPGASFLLLESLYGHDGFLLEFKQLEAAMRAHLEPAVSTLSPAS